MVSVTDYQEAFVGHEEFVEEAERKAGKKVTTVEGSYSMPDIVPRVCEVVGIEREKLRKSIKKEKVGRGWELFMHVATRHSKASLRVIVSWLGVRDLSTASHKVRRAEVHLKEDQDFSRRLDEVLRGLSHSRIQACPLLFHRTAVGSLSALF